MTSDSKERHPPTLSAEGPVCLGVGYSSWFSIPSPQFLVWQEPRKDNKESGSNHFVHSVKVLAFPGVLA